MLFWGGQFRGRNYAKVNITCPGMNGSLSFWTSGSKIVFRHEIPCNCTGVFLRGVMLLKSITAFAPMTLPSASLMMVMVTSALNLILCNMKLINSFYAIIKELKNSKTSPVYPQSRYSRGWSVNLISGGWCIRQCCVRRVLVEYFILINDGLKFITEHTSFR